MPLLNSQRQFELESKALIDFRDAVLTQTLSGELTVNKAHTEIEQVT